MMSLDAPSCKDADRQEKHQLHLFLLPTGSAALLPEQATCENWSSLSFPTVVYQISVPLSLNERGLHLAGSH